MGNLLEQGLAAKQTGAVAEAESYFWAVLAEDATCAPAYFHLGELNQAKRDYVLAISLYEKALEYQPLWPEIFNNLGVIAAEQGQNHMAEGYFAKAVELQPKNAAFHHNWALALCQVGLHAQALEQGLQALALAPEWEANFYQEALHFLDQHIYAGAEFYLTLLIAFKGKYHHGALRKLAFSFQQQGQPILASQSYQQAIHLKSDFQTQAAAKLLLPPIYQSMTDLLEWRTRFIQGLNELMMLPPQDERELWDLDLSWFYLAYQGFNERNHLEQLASLAQTVVPAVVYPQVPRPAGEQRRIGFVSRFFSDHAVAQCFGGLLAACERHDGFAVCRFGLPGTPNQPGITLLPSALPAARQVIANHHIDILVYTDIGLEPISWLLALTRLAPHQCVLAGHPLTTGISTIDCFVSSTLLEPPHAQEHYSESLLLLPHPPVAFASPPPVSHVSKIGLPAGNRYVCPTTLYKIHPDFDRVVQEILQQDPQAQVLFFKDPYRPFHLLLQQRWNTLPGIDTQRIHFLPWLSAQHFAEVLGQAKVILDPLHFGMGTTAYLALLAGIPTVTLPAPFLRGRSTAGLSQHVGVIEGLVERAEAYAPKACQLAMEGDLHHHVTEQLQQNRERLLEQSAGVEALLAHWQQLNLA